MGAIMRNVVKTDLFKIIFANIVSQGFLLILSGTFWDDWGSYYCDRIASIRSGIEIGRPVSAFWSRVVWNLPNYGYRWLVFLGFLFTSIILYVLLSKSDGFSRKEALYISLLYTVFPINDARVLLATFPYSVGWLSFFIGLYMFALWWKDNSRKKPLLRVITLLFFVHSFILNSLLVYYAIVLLYILYMEYIYNRSIMKAIVRMFKYVDFILLPIVYFVGKQLLFPAYGRYEGYNSVTLSKVLSAAYSLPIVTIKHVWAIWSDVFDSFVPHRVTLICSAVIVLYGVLQFVCYMLDKKSLKRICEGEGIRNSGFAKIVLGIIMFVLGLYPYMVAHNTTWFAIYGVDSRDSMLLGPGLALILFYCFNMAWKKEITRKVTVYIIIFFSILTCNVHYMNYQRDAYWQEVLIYQLSLNDQIREAENILFLSDDDTGISGTRFYSLNGDASVAYGDQSRLFMYGYSDLHMLQTDRSVLVESGADLMNDYDVNHNKLDCVVVYSCDINYIQCLKLKLLEMFRYSRYREIIENMGSLNYYPADSPEAIELLEGV